MSKVDAQRAMREANYAARSRVGGPNRGVATPVGGTSTPPPARSPGAKRSPAPAAVPTAAAEGARCGHKSMNGRACTREAAHSEKNHRYS